MLPDQKALSPKLLTYGSGSGFMSLNPVVPSGQLHLHSDPAIRYSLRHGLIRVCVGVKIGGSRVGGPELRV